MSRMDSASSLKRKFFYQLFSIITFFSWREGGGKGFQSILFFLFILSVKSTMKMELRLVMEFYRKIEFFDIARILFDSITIYAELVQRYHWYLRFICHVLYFYYFLNFFTSLQSENLCHPRSISVLNQYTNIQSWNFLITFHIESETWRHILLNAMLIKINWTNCKFP